MRDLMREAMVDALREDLIDLSAERIERFLGDEHRGGRRLAVPKLIDFDDVEFLEREWPEEGLVEFDDLEGQVRELLHGPRVLAGVRGHANRQSVLCLFFKGIPARQHDGK